MTIMPGAVWRPISVPGGLSARTKGRAVILHVAASEATSLFGFFNGNASANSHFYVAKNGTIEQYIDTNYQSWTSMTANKNTIGVETQGGVTNADGEPWTAAQVASLARICAWAHADEGVPLQLMPNSLPASKGIGWHRLGIDPWRVSGGEVWSSSRGKVCPGDAKVAQVPLIVSRATEIVNGDDDVTPAQQKTLDDMAWLVGQMKPVVDVIHNAVISGDGAGPGNNFAWLYNQEDPKLDAIIDALGKVQAPAIDEAKLAAALLADPDAVQALGKAIADNLQLSPRS